MRVSVTYPMLRYIVFCVLVPLTTTPVAAKPSAKFSVANFASFNAGEPQGVVVSREGEVRIGRGLTAINLPKKASMVWARARAADGTVYFGTGAPAHLLAVRGERVRVLATLDGILVTALTMAAPGQLIAATMPDAALVAIDLPSGRWKRLAKLPAKHVWALLYRQSTKTIYAATGAPGKVFSIRPGQKPKVYFDPGETHLLSMAFDVRQRVLVGSSDKAILYRIERGGRATALHDFSGTELRDLAVASDGTIYCAVNQFPQKTAGLPRYDRQDAGKGGTAPPSVAKKTKPKFAATELRPGSKSGKGALFRLDVDGRVEGLLSLPRGYFTDLAIDQRGLVWAAEGTKGRMFLVRQRREVMTAFDVQQRQVLALAVSGESQYIATGDAGALYRVVAEPPKPHYLSQAFDAKYVARWGRVYVRSLGEVSVRSRSGNTAKPDKTWSDWQKARRESEQRVVVLSPPARYVQLKFEWSDPKTILRSYELFYRAQNQPARVTKVGFARKSAPGKPRTPIVSVKWAVSNPDKDPLIYRLHYRNEGGAVWRRIRSDKVIVKASFDWNTEAIPDGLYRVRVTSSDEKANGPASTAKSAKMSDPVIVDNRKPTLVGVNLRFPWVSGTARDAYSPLARIEYSVDGGRWRLVDVLDGVYDTPAESFRVRLPDELRPGSHILALRAVDAAGNAGVTELRFRR